MRQHLRGSEMMSPGSRHDGLHPVKGAGLGLRRVHFDALLGGLPPALDFLEVAPENWLEVGGRSGRQFRAIAERAPLVCHGLAVDLGGQRPLDRVFLGKLRHFLDEVHACAYSEHLSYCADHAHLYDLLPLPFTEETVRHVAARIGAVQDALGRRIAIENVSYYAAPATVLSELEFLNAVIEEADCLLHFDLNNVYVNSINLGYDAEAFVRGVPGARIAWAHVAGHHREAADLCIDTHGASVIDPVWNLLELAYSLHGVFPTLLERDFDVPPLDVLLAEVETIATLQARHAAPRRRTAHG